MAVCRCKSKTKIVSNVVLDMNNNKYCTDVCTNPIYGDPKELNLMAPLIYDEIGINLCATFEIGTDIPTTYPTVTSATIRPISAAYTYGDEAVSIEAINGRPNCTRIVLRDITVTFALELYDESCRRVATVFPTAVYLPQTTTPPTTYDEDTNPSSVELEIYTPYGVSYDTTAAPPTPVINYTGFSADNNAVSQGLNLYTRAKLIDFNFEDSEVTVGLTIVVQSLYFAGYRVESEGKIDTPKGCIMSRENSECMTFVAGDLLDLAIRPLVLGGIEQEECLKEDCSPAENSCAGQK